MLPQQLTLISSALSLSRKDSTCCCLLPLKEISICCLHSTSAGILTSHWADSVHQIALILVFFKHCYQFFSCCDKIKTPINYCYDTCLIIINHLHSLNYCFPALRTAPTEFFLNVKFASYTYTFAVPSA